MEKEGEETKSPSRKKGKREWDRNAIEREEKSERETAQKGESETVNWDFSLRTLGSLNSQSETRVDFPFSFAPLLYTTTTELYLLDLITCSQHQT